MMAVEQLPTYNLGYLTKVVKLQNWLPMTSGGILN